MIDIDKVSYPNYYFTLEKYWPWRKTLLQTPLLNKGYMVIIAITQA